MDKLIGIIIIKRLLISAIRKIRTPERYKQSTLYHPMAVGDFPVMRGALYLLC